MTTGQQIVLCTCSDKAVAQIIAKRLVERRLAACVNLVAGVESVYRWQGKIEHDNEILLIIKSSAECFDKLEKNIRELHPDELPELIAISIEGGSKNYLDWINENVLPS